MRSCEASLVILFIATSPQVPKQVQMEETFESIVNMTKFQLENNVFPEFDPVYKVDPSGKGIDMYEFLIISCYLLSISRKWFVTKSQTEKWHKHDR